MAKQLMFVAVIALTFQSCIKDNFDKNKIAEVKWDPNFAVPLVYSSLTMENMLKKSKDFLHTENDGSLTLVYTTTVGSLDVSSIATLKLPDQPTQNITILTTPISGPIPGGGAVMPVQTQTVTFRAADTTATIDSIFFKAGTFDFTFSSDIPDNVTITITIPGAKKNGAIFSKTIALNYTGASPTTASPSYDLTGYDFDLTQGSSTVHNTIEVQYAITVNGSGSLLGTEHIQISTSMKDLQYYKFFGNLGRQTITIQPDTIPITIFKNAMGGSSSFTLAHPTIKLISHNSFGIPLTVHFPQLYGETSSGTIDSIANSFSINALAPNLSQVGQSLAHTDSLTAGNSHIVSVISNTPKNIVYSIIAQTNALLASQNNFVLDTSHLKIDMEVNLPLDGTASNFTLVDTLPFSALDNQNISDNVSSAVFRVYTSNGFPLDVDMQIYFVDSLYKKLDSLIVPPDSKPRILASGSIDATTKRVVTAGVASEDIIIDRAKLKRLSTTKKLIIQAKASTTNSGTQEVKIYSDYKLELKLGLQIHVEAKFNPNKK